MNWVSLLLGMPKNSSIPHGMKELDILEICTSSNLRAKLLCDILRVKNYTYVTFPKMDVVR